MFIENVVAVVAVAVAVAVVVAVVAVVAFMENMKFKDKFTLNQFFILLVSVMECARAQ